MVRDGGSDHPSLLIRISVSLVNCQFNKCAISLHSCRLERNWNGAKARRAAPYRDSRFETPGEQISSFKRNQASRQEQKLT